MSRTKLFPLLAIALYLTSSAVARKNWDRVSFSKGDEIAEKVIGSLHVHGQDCVH